MILHLFLLHSSGSSNPIGLWSFNKLFFYPHYFIKDAITFVIIVLVLLRFTFTEPLIFIDADN
jgi:quinol-cytochrome oxidoreductase complex cytochrome b subunit